MKSLVTVASNALMYTRVPLKMNKQTLFSLHLLDTKNRETKIRTDQNGSEDELDVGPVHTGQQRT